MIHFDIGQICRTVSDFAHGDYFRRGNNPNRIPVEAHIRMSWPSYEKIMLYMAR